MKKLVLLLLLVALATSQIVEPKLVNRIEASVRQGGVITVEHGQLYSFELNVTIPQETVYQITSSTNSLVEDSEGNKMALIFEDNPSYSYNYELTTTVETNERITRELPDAYSVPSDLVKYVQPSETVQSDHIVMKQMAELITANSSSEFEKIAKLTQWVHENIEYNISLVGQRKDALWVMENKQGVCVEYSSLFAALARSLGYPTRFVLGQAYGDYGWLGHAWNEVYLGEWVPVDATWLEAGHLDAVHIELFKSIESISPNTILAKVSDGASINWEKPEFGGESGGIDVETQTIIESFEDTDYDLFLVSDSLGFDEETLIVLGVQGKDYRLIDAAMVPCQSETELIELTNPEQILVLEPGKTTYAIWKIKTSSDLNPNIIYTCPFTLNSAYLEEQSVPLTIQRKYNPSGFSAFLSDEEVGVGEIVSVFVKASSDEEITVIETNYLDSRLASPGTTEFKFSPLSSGIGSIFVASNKSGVEELSFSVTKQPQVYVKSISFAKEFIFGDEPNVTMLLENTIGTPEPVSIRITFGDTEHLSRHTIDGLTEVEFTIIAGEPGDQVLNVEISGEGFTDQKSMLFTVYEPPSVIIGEPFTKEYNEKMLVTIPLNASNSVTGLKASLGGQTSTVTGSNATFLVEPGMHTLNLSWSDVLGNDYSEIKVITTNAPKTANVFHASSFLIAVVAGLVLFVLVYIGSKIIKKARS